MNIGFIIIPPFGKAHDRKAGIKTPRAADCCRFTAECFSHVLHGLIFLGLGFCRRHGVAQLFCAIRKGLDSIVGILICINLIANCRIYLSVFKRKLYWNFTI